MNATDVFKPDVLKGTVAFITGGGSGINLGIGEVLASLGADVAICGRTQSRLDEGIAVLSKHGTNVRSYVADVRDFDALSSAMEKTREDLGPISFVVAGAAGNFVVPAENLSANGFKTVIDIDLAGAIHASRAAFEQLKETKGSILFISGGQAINPFEFQAHVGAAKAGIDNMMQNLALEWGKYGIRANSIVPGPIEDTKGMEVLGGDNPQEVWVPMIPLSRFGTKEEVGALAAFLATPMGNYISGARITIDGGQNLTGSVLFNQAVRSALNAAN